MTTPEPFVRDRVWAFDIALSFAVAFLCVLPYRYEFETALLGAVLAASLMFRRTIPPLAIAMGVTACLAQLLLSTEPTLSLVAVPILVYSVARWTEGSIGRITVSIALTGSVLGPIRWSLDYGITGRTGPYGIALMMACLAGVAAVYVLGRRRRDAEVNSFARRQSEAERQRLMLAEQQQRERSVTVEERNRIARELHDIVAHSLSVIVVQAEGGRALAARRPEKAGEVLGTIAETSREALDEMRRMVQLLRGDAPQSEAYVPTPGLRDLAELVRKTSDLAQLTTFGTMPRVSPALGLTAYRIVQESLTNVLKHAGPGAVARVSVAYTGESIELEISDDGSGRRAPGAVNGDGRGHGLQGMRERVALHGGRLLAGARATGFVVRASLPYASEPGIPRPIDDLRVMRR